MEDTSLKLLSSTQLKFIAMLTMLIDHVAASGLILKLYTGSGAASLYFVMRMIGRVAFPIYLFLLVEGFVHTKNIKKYIIRMAIFAVISEVPFDMAFANSIFDIYNQNVMWSLLICIIMLYFMKKYSDFAFVSIVIACVLAWFIKCDYSFVGPLATACLYLYRDRKIVRNVSTALIFSFEPTAIISLIPISIYSGERGMNIKYLFYAFYPAHLLILVYIRYLIK